MSTPVLVIVLAQLFGTSLWFSTNSVAQSLAAEWRLGVEAVVYLTIAVQAGFIVGTLFLSFSGLADRFAASRIFAICAALGSLCNAALMMVPGGFATTAALRFTTGLALAGVYPIGMKLIVSWVPDKAGPALGWLVGMLTLGTALPHLLRGLGAHWPWQAVVGASSGLALLAATSIAFLGDGPFLPKAGKQAGIGAGALFGAFRRPAFRGSAFGYFGHMWELYAFWTIAPFLATNLVASSAWPATIAPLLTFATVAAGALGCIGGGWVSKRSGNIAVAVSSLAVSGLICLVYPLLIDTMPNTLGIVVLLVWGIAVVADSPQFSALSARAAPTAAVGVALSIQNGIGFSLTIPAIGLVVSNWTTLGPKVSWILLPGPIIGLIAIWRSPLWKGLGKD